MLDHCIRDYHCIQAYFSYSEEQMQHVLLRAYGGWDRNYIILVNLVRGTPVREQPFDFYGRGGQEDFAEKIFGL